MPWIKADKGYPDTGKPSYYTTFGIVMSDDTSLGRHIEYMKEQRKKAGQLREEMLGYQKVCGQQKDIETARFFREIASDLMKEYRGWDSAIIIIEGDGDWKHGHVTEPIAPYVDMAFHFTDLHDSTLPPHRGRNVHE